MRRVQGQCGPPTQRPYDIHSGNAVESLVQLFSTASVQYVPSWSKDMVALLRKVRPPGARAGPGPCPEGGWRAVSLPSSRQPVGRLAVLQQPRRSEAGSGLGHGAVPSSQPHGLVLGRWSPSCRRAR